MTPLEMIAAERQRQIEKEGWSTEHDDEHEDESLAMAAALYASPNDDLHIVKICEECGTHGPVCDPWPWWTINDLADRGKPDRSHAWDKRYKHDRMRRLQIAGALIVAEMERLQRIADSQEKSGIPS